MWIQDLIMCVVYLLMGLPFLHPDLCPRQLTRLSFIKCAFWLLARFGHWGTTAGDPEVFVLLDSLWRGG